MLDPPPARSPIAVRTGEIRLRSLAVDRGRRRVLTVDELVLRPGVTTLIGPNGSGKSTLLHVIAGMLDPVSGTLTIDGRSPLAMRRQIAYVLQTTGVTAGVPVTVAETVALGRAATLGPFRPLRRADRIAIDDAMARLDIGDLRRRHLAELSGGQRQRVFVAQGLAQHAAVLLLDEPMAGLDLPSAELIRAVVSEERAAGRVVVIATHDLAEASRSDTAVLLAGRVVAAGSPVDVLRPEHLRAAYHGQLLDLGDHVLALDEGGHHH